MVGTVASVKKAVPCPANPSRSSASPEMKAKMSSAPR